MSTGFSVRSLTKSYGGNVVLDGVDLSVKSGEIHALLGANGAGKSTLIKCIAGVIRPDGGEIEINGNTFAGLTPRQSRTAGVAVVYQELSLTKSLSVAENVFLGSELKFGPFLRGRAQRAESQRLLQELGLTIDSKAILDTLGTAEAQGIEIVKAMRRHPGVLILDEPTAALTGAEAAELAVQLKRLRANGLPLLYVTHRLDEVFQLADRVSILRAGRVVLSRPISQCSPEDLVQAISGKSSWTGGVLEVPEGEQVAEPLLTAKDVRGPGIGPIDLELRSGEILGVFGLVGRPVHFANPSDAVASGVALVPSDRAHKGLFAGLSAEENLVLPAMKRLGRFGIRRRSAEHAAFASMATYLRLQPNKPTMESGRFSGGNQQKLILGRWLHAKAHCRVLLLDEPTQGVDVGARGELYEGLRAFSKNGGAVLLASSEPEELRLVADRVIVLSRGRIVGELKGPEITEPTLLKMAHLTELSGASA
jgi:ribose transport system ATP-binding protein